MVTDSPPAAPPARHGFVTYMAGTLAARVGDWMDLVALNWAVLQLTQSPVHLAIINACRLVPAFALSVPAGLMADRLDRKALLAWLQAGTVVGSLALAAMFAAHAPFALVAAVVAARACAMAMEPVARGALLPQLVAPEALTRAVAVNSSAFTIARFAGPALAAMLMAAFSAPWVFVANAALAAAALVTLAWVKPRESAAPTSTKPRTVKGDLGEAWTFLKGSAPVRALMVLAIAPMVFGFPYTAMLPFFAQALHGFDAAGFALLLSVSAVGAFAATAALAARRAHGGEERLLVVALLGFGACLNAFMLAPAAWAAYAALFGVGLFGQGYRTLSRATLQARVPDHLRGRILSVALMDRGFIPLGALGVGAAAALWGPLPAGLAMGTGCAAVTVLVVARGWLGKPAEPNSPG